MAVEYRRVGENTMQYAVQDGADGGRNGGCDRAESRVNSWPCLRKNTEGGNPGWRIGTFLLRTRNLANLRQNPPSQVFGKSAKLWGYRALGRSIRVLSPLARRPGMSLLSPEPASYSISYRHEQALGTAGDTPRPRASAEIDTSSPRTAPRTTQRTRENHAQPCSSHRTGISFSFSNDIPFGSLPSKIVRTNLGDKHARLRCLRICDGSIPTTSDKAATERNRPLRSRSIQR